MQGEMKYRIKNNFCFRGEVLELSIENKEKICEISHSPPFSIEAQKLLN
jgi:hypothetical protein